MKLRTREPERATPDMTPLIDCVFLLILFFILTTKITVQVEEVELPVALEGEEQQEGGGATSAPLIINIVRDPEGLAKDRGERAGLIRFGGETLKKEELLARLKEEARYDREPPPAGRGNGFEPGPSGKKLSKLKVLVRGDRGVRAEFTRDVFWACGQAGIYRVIVASIDPE